LAGAFKEAFREAFREAFKQAFFLKFFKDSRAFQNHPTNNPIFKSHSHLTYYQDSYSLTIPTRIAHFSSLSLKVHKFFLHFPKNINLLSWNERNYKKTVGEKKIMDQVIKCNFIYFYITFHF
jgi:hypothetical protein